ncbi:putative glycolipid-binding domain-containing protein [Chitinophaga lutea]
MKTQAVWKATFTGMMEYCEINTTDTDIRINGTVVGFMDVPFSVDYDIIVTHAWETAALELTIRKGGESSWISLQRDPNGKWSQNGHPRPEWDACKDIDISVTPFTNTLPINRLRMGHHVRHHLDVLYINVLKDEIRPVDQWYTRLSDRSYLYEGVAKDFKAVLQVDEGGLVNDYEGLFQRIQA